MCVAQNKELVRDFLDLTFNQGNFTAFYYTFTNDYVNHNPAIPTGGNIHGYARFITNLRAIYPDLHLTVEGQYGDGAMVITRFTICAAQMHSSGVEVARMRNGKVAEAWLKWDAPLLAQHRSLAAIQQ